MPRAKHGGDTNSSHGNVKFDGGQAENKADKSSFRSKNDRAKAGFFDGSRGSEKRNKQESTKNAS